MKESLANEEFRNYAVLRLPIESGRQSPQNLAGNMLLASFLQAGLFAAEYYIVGYSSGHPWKEQVLTGHFWFTAILIALSLLYSFPAVYRRSEKLQYLISILVSQNLFGITFYICAMFVATRGTEASAESMVNFTWISLLIGLLVFLLVFVRLIRKIRRGDYREGSRQEEMREQFEYKSYIPAATMAGLGIFFVLQYVIRQNGWTDFGSLLFALIGFGLFYAMLFVLPEQLVILYCKFRFRCFNYNGGSGSRMTEGRF
ncbi:hypothetical protein AV656_06465 [Bhargavaea cecembensis]|uniref:ABC transporter ATPase n=1 Tax=Bhargavaea cecembensis TaxID=394098 RepID=A0A163FF04_9BACL|nr:hypothetical protein [Bhargavaea cecembensis]KZE38546.1 hypothetical protein AV656_06465 [Bhargavaea cecembensis]